MLHVPMEGLAMLMGDFSMIEPSEVKANGS